MVVNKPTILFSSPEAKKWFEFVIENWKPSSNIVIFLPCASKKPFYTSVTHRSFFSIFWKLWKKNKISVVILSEPLTVVPAEYDYPMPRYPLYDYPPSFIKERNKMAEKERLIWRERLNYFFRVKNSVQYYFLLYPYHKRILGDILEKHAIGYYTTRPYISKTVKKLLGELKFSPL